MKKKYFLVMISFLIGMFLLFIFSRNWYWHYYWDTATSEQRTYLPKLDPCYVPWDVAIDGQSATRVFAWEDVNANGVSEANEPALPNVIILLAGSDYLYSSGKPPIPWDKLESSPNLELEYLQITDKAGNASLWDFKPGCACNCWEGDAVFAWGPSIYEPTVPTRVQLTQEDQIIRFGFHRIK